MLVRRIKSLFMRIAVFALIASILTTVFFAVAANIIVPVTRTERLSRSITVNEVKPDACAGIYLNNLVSGSASGTTANDLLLGNAADNSLTGAEGNDCNVGGSGNDTCVGTTDDIFVSCEIIQTPTP